MSHDVIPESRPGHSLELLYVGRDPYRKGLPDILAALDVFRQRYTGIRLTIVANLPRDLARRARSMRNVKVIKPRFSLAELTRCLYAAADLFVMPTREDTFGMVFQEALAAGTPVLATRQFAVPEIVQHGRTGWLIEHDPLFLDREVIPVPRAESEYALEPAIERQIVDDLVGWIAHAFHHRQELRSMGERASQQFRGRGRFAVARRNEVLREIFGVDG